VALLEVFYTLYDIQISLLKVQNVEITA